MDSNFLKTIVSLPITIPSNASRNRLFCCFFYFFVFSWIFKPISVESLIFIVFETRLSLGLTLSIRIFVIIWNYTWKANISLNYMFALFHSVTLFYFLFSNRNWFGKKNYISSRTFIHISSIKGRKKSWWEHAWVWAHFRHFESQDDV